VEYEKTMQMKYLDAVFHESLRVLPPVIFFCSRTCIQETVVKGIRILPGMKVMVPVHGVHWDPDNWSEPQKYDPER
jgi:cytochrome P450